MIWDDDKIFIKKIYNIKKICYISFYRKINKRWYYMSDNKQEKKEKNKKINKMTLEEIEKAIEKTKKSMNGLNSRYAKELIKQRDYLFSLKK